MKRKTICLIVVRAIIFSGFTAQAEELYTPKDKKVVAVDFSEDEDDLEPCPHMMSIDTTKRKPKLEIGGSLLSEKHYYSDKNFGTENDEKPKTQGRSIAAVDKEKPKPVSLRKALKTFKQQAARNNYESED